MEERLVVPGVKIGDHEYFTVHQLAVSIGCHPDYILREVRAGRLHGRVLGKVYLISADEFRDFVRSGRFNYRARVTHNHGLGRELELAEQREAQRLLQQQRLHHDPASDDDV